MHAEDINITWSNATRYERFYRWKSGERRQLAINSIRLFKKGHRIGVDIKVKHVVILLRTK